MAGLPNTHVYKEDWAENLQLRLSEPTKWKDICTVDYTNTKVLNNPYLTDPSVQSYTRQCPYAFQAIVETTESVQITTGKVLAQFVDRADMAQSGYLKQMEMSDRQAVLLNEAIEAAVYADFASMTTFDDSTLEGGSGSIIVSASNVDDIIRGVKQQIITNSGGARLDRDGGFFVWRPSDFNFLEAFAQANGFTVADKALGNGVGNGFAGFNYMGFTHYTSNQLTAGHVIAGVKKAYYIGILRDTYGQIVVNPYDPALYSGISITSRVDFKGIVWTKQKPLLYNCVVG